MKKVEENKERDIRDVKRCYWAGGPMKTSSRRLSKKLRGAAKGKTAQKRK